MRRFEWEPKDRFSYFMKAGAFEWQDVGIRLVFLHEACWCSAQPNWSFLSDLSAPLPLQCRSWMFNGNVGCFWARQTRFAAWQKYMNWKAEGCCEHRKSQQPLTSKQPSAQEKLGEYRLHFLVRSSARTHDGSVWFWTVFRTCTSFPGIFLTWFYLCLLAKCLMSQ